MVKLTEMERQAMAEARNKKEEASETTFDFAEEGTTEVAIEQEDNPTDVGGDLVGSGLNSADIEAFSKLAGPSAEVKVEEVEEEVEGIEKEAEAIEEDTICNRCGYNLSISNDLSNPTESDKEEFIRSILGSRPFEWKTYCLNDKMSIRFQSITTEEEKRVNELLSKRIEDKKITTMLEWENEREEFRLTLMLKEITLGNDVKSFDKLDISTEDFGVSILKRVNEIDKYPEAISGVVNLSFRKFNDLYTKLTARSFDADFWKGLQDSKQ